MCNYQFIYLRLLKLMKMSLALIFHIKWLQETLNSMIVLTLLIVAKLLGIH